MKTALFCSLAFCLAAGAHAQDPGQTLTQHGTTGHVSILPVVQIWEDGDGSDYFGEVSVPVSAHFALGGRVSLSLRGSGAAADGTNFEPLSGVADAQAALTIRQEVGQAVLAVSVSASLPSGKRELTAEEFTTSLLLNRNIFRFQVPSFGQGFNVAPGLLVAYPLSERVVIGLGGSYQVKGAYRPLASLAEDYDPGDELMITGGFDARLGLATTLSADLILTHYGTDTLGEEEIFGAGQKLVAGAQLRHAFGFHEFWILGRYRSRAKNEIAVAGALVEEAEQSIPNQTEFFGHLRFRLSGGFSLRLMAEGRFFDAAPGVESLSVLGLGLGPEFGAGPVRVPLHFKGYFGDFRGAEASLGLVVTI